MSAASGEGDPSSSWTTAEEAFREIRATFWLAVTLLEHGEWLASQERADEAATAPEEARSIFERLKATPWLERLDKVSLPVAAPEWKPRRSISDMSSKGSVLVAMSGGVDSSVAACLLLEQGYEVVGSHMQLVHLEGVEHGCCGPAARADAAEVARIAGFPFGIYDLTLEFDEHVIDDFVSEHEAGRTPNPCARCNGEIKFGAFLRQADELGIDAVATGHYVRSSKDEAGRWRLFRGLDRSKDQSYMLHMLGQRELARSLFPIGGLEKSETRAIAGRFGLPVATKPDSQELCFAPSGDAGRFLGEIAPYLMREGEVVDTNGRVLARHGGAAAFTVGQRRGLGVSGHEPSYVLEVDAAANRVVVGPGELLSRRGLIADRVSWVAGAAPAQGPFEADVRIRYRGEDGPAVIEPDGDRIRVEFRTPQRGVAPGQSVVVFRGEELLGGGRILQALR